MKIKLSDKIMKNKFIPKSENYKFWKNIQFSIISIEYSLEIFNKNLEQGFPQIAIIFAKSIVMELWNIRSFLKKLNIDISKFDGNFPKLKLLRDSYAHIDERIEGNKLINGEKEQLFKQPTNLCGGKLKKNSESGIWEIRAKITFNCNFLENKIISIFALIDDYLICNDYKKISELRINTKIIDKLEKILLK